MATQDPRSSPAPSPVDGDVIDVPYEQIVGPMQRVVRDMQRVSDPFEHFAKVQAISAQLTKAAVAETRAQDWIVMGRKDDPASKAYLQSTGAERLQRLGGLVMAQPTVEREDHADGTFSYIVNGPMASRLLGIVVQVEGGRWSGEEFFDFFSVPKPENFKQLTEGERLAWRLANRLPVPPMEVRKAAHTNWRVRGISMLMGLRNLTLADLGAMGIDPNRVGAITFNTGGQGGKARAGGGSKRLTPDRFGPFGARNKPIDAISDEHLLAYIDLAKKAIADPAKAQYRSKEEAWLDDLLMEQDARRADKASAIEAPGDPDGHYPG